MKLFYVRKQLFYNELDVSVSLVALGTNKFILLAFFIRFDEIIYISTVVR